MSYLRSCYETDCRFYADRPDVVNRVIWYWVDEDAPWLPFDNLFSARTWYDGFLTAWPQLGEVEGAERPWRDGSPPIFPVVPSPCGRQEAFVDGVPFAEAGSKPHTTTGQLLCCVPGGGPAALIWVSTFVPPVPSTPPPGGLIVAGSVARGAMFDFAQYLCDGLNLAGVELGLFVNTPNLTLDTVEADFVEPSYPGYSRVGADAFVPDIAGPNSQGIKSPTNIFSATGASPGPEMIQGIFGVTLAGQYLWATYFADGPQFPPSPGTPSDYSFVCDFLNATPMAQSLL